MLLSKQEADELQKYTASPHILALRDVDGDTPINKALRNAASDELLQQLIDLAYDRSSSVDVGELGGTTEDILMEDVSHAHALEMTDGDGNSLLHTAISHFASPQTLNHLLDKHPPLLAMTNDYLQTSLHVAIKNHHFDQILAMAKRINVSLHYIDDALRAQDNNGKGPLALLWDTYFLMGGTQEYSIDHTHGDRSSLVTDPSHNHNALAAAALECIEMLLLASFEMSRLSDSDEINEEDGGNSPIAGDTTNNDQDLALSWSYCQLQSCINLGEDVIPTGYIKHLFHVCPEIPSIVRDNGLDDIWVMKHS